MPAIKPRTRQKHSVRHITRLFHENNETLFGYAAFIDERTDYVLNQLIETVLARDRDFQEWLVAHPGPHVPAPGSSRPARRRTGSRPSTDAARPRAVAATTAG
jgi:hypothetical protein